MNFDNRRIAEGQLQSHSVADLLVPSMTESSLRMPLSSKIKPQTPSTTLLEHPLGAFA